jgi:hypothetical protein
MPRKPIDYSKCLIYKICCKDPNISDIYVGHTTDLRKRKNCHRSRCNNKNYEYYYLYVYQFIRDHGNFDNFEIIVIEQYPCENSIQASARERYWLETLQATLNKYVPSRTKQEYEEQYREQKNKYNIQYREQNGEYYRQYREQNREIINEKAKQYREQNEEKRNEKFKCECNGRYTKSNQALHFKTKKHLKYLENQINNSNSI